MADTEQKRNNATHFFDLLERNLPRQEAGNDTKPLTSLEFIFWMIGLTCGFVLIQYFFHLLF
jgi:hypothetical protein